MSGKTPYGFTFLECFESLIQKHLELTVCTYKQATMLIAVPVYNGLFIVFVNNNLVRNSARS